MTVTARLFAPGPVEVPTRVLEACARPPLHHRSSEFAALFTSVKSKLGQVAGVEGEEVLIVTGSGTAAFEAGLLACVPQGAKVVAMVSGKFGERWAKMCEGYGFEVVPLAFPWGKVVDVAAVENVLGEHPDASAIIVVHSETSTGTLNDVAGVATVARRIVPEALVLVDAVTSLAVAELRPLDWQLDGVFFGSQKGLFSPPGLGFAWLSERAWARGERLAPSFYLDLRRERARQADGHTAFTPAVTLIAGLDVALSMLLEEGIAQVWSRMRRLNEAVLAAGRAAGCEPFAAVPSPAVAALRPPPGITGSAVVAQFAAYGARIAGGQDELKEAMFRPSLMGHRFDSDAVMLAGMLEGALRSLGARLAHGTAVGAAMSVLQGARK